MGLFFRETWISFFYFFGFHLSVILITKFSDTLWKIYITFLSMLKNDSIFKMSCSFFPKIHIMDLHREKEDITTVPVKSCANNIFDHLSALGVSGETQSTSGCTQIGEAEVLFNRDGFIAPSQKQVDEFTVWPRHRYLLPYGWPGRKRLTCFHPDHLGKRTKQNNARRVNLEMSRSIYFLENHSVPLGAGKRKHYYMHW